MDHSDNQRIHQETWLNHSKHWHTLLYTASSTRKSAEKNQMNCFSGINTNTFLQRLEKQYTIAVKG